MYCIVLDCIVLYCIVLYCIVLYELHPSCFLSTSTFLLRVHFGFTPFLLYSRAQVSAIFITISSKPVADPSPYSDIGDVQNQLYSSTFHIHWSAKLLMFVVSQNSADKSYKKINL